MDGCKRTDAFCNGGWGIIVKSKVKSEKLKVSGVKGKVKREK